MSISLNLWLLALKDKVNLWALEISPPIQFTRSEIGFTCSSSAGQQTTTVLIPFVLLKVVWNLLEMSNFMQMVNDKR